MSIKDHLLRFRESIEPKATLVAVSKTKPISDLQEAYNAGQRHFGENKIQEMTEKWETLPKDIHWHMIGHTQRNKVKYMAPYVHLIHSVDSPRLLKEINKQAAKNERVIDCLLQIHIAEEETKFGFDQNELLELLSSDAFAGYKNVRITGLMGMATFTDNKEQVRKEFKSLKTLLDHINDNHLISDSHEFKTLSMGMTGDYEIAMKEGSTMVRIGSAIFGSRA
ncbi:YggS family pyridoxal phosphate-dependent enzyme [Nonlabens ulvanivorans]|uniref:YggS family pyridoxal phosphate-dependent enzyme n=1 Tax=Nonlabens ulvanivorans TaxID=906888 RepID=UPI00294395F2|nr:YggS family pyridoxal phosphate-dependent enzyme [Nonlabens ulvanivorans]WOI22922.1 YggS family pyridoxal phosphate-dependent enzyme [Nonlabens ulvanivorans]